MRAILVVAALMTASCATGADPESTGPSTPRSDANAGGDSSTAAPDAAGTDSSMALDSGIATTDSSSPTVDTGVAPDDTSMSIDAGAAEDTGPFDTGVLDTGSPVTDTGTVMCSASGEYGGKCKTNLDCALIAGCGYVCCGYDPTGTISLGCGRIAAGSFCLP